MSWLKAAILLLQLANWLIQNSKKRDLLSAHDEQRIRELKSEIDSAILSMSVARHTAESAGLPDNDKYRRD